MTLGKKVKYIIPKNMTNKDKVWSNGNLYLTWFDVGQILLALILCMVITFLEMKVWLSLLISICILGLTLVLCLIKPLGYSFWYYIGLVTLFYMGNKQWLWQRGKHR